MRLIHRFSRIASRWSSSASRGALVGVAGASLALGAIAASGCGPKPKAKAKVVVVGATTPSDPAGPEAPVEKPEERTRGGVDLGVALESAGAARAEVFAAAQLLSKDRPAAVAQLIGLKGAAKATVLALFESRNLDELIGALLVVQADGDPTGTRADASEQVFALLDHEVGAVRDVAWETASKVADGAGLAKLLPGLAHDKALAVVRLLAAWDGEPVQTALWQLVTGADAELAIEAALALSSPGKGAGSHVSAQLEGFVKDASDAHLRLALIVNRRFPHDPKAKLSAVMKDAIDRALSTKDEPLVIEGVRSTALLPAEEREPLYEQLALDPRPAVRAVTAEMLARVTTATSSTVLLGKLLTDAEGDVRMAAASARAQIGTPAERLAALQPLLTDNHRGVRLAASLSLAQPDMVALCSELLVKQLDREDDEGRKVILGALTSSSNRVGLLTVIDMLGGSDTKRAVAAHFALTSATKQDFAVDIGAWKAWLDKTYPAPAAPAPAATAPDKEPKAPTEKPKAPAPK